MSRFEKSSFIIEDPELLAAEATLRDLASVFLADPSMLNWVCETMANLDKIKMVPAESFNLEARYRTLLEQIPAVVFMASLDKGIGEAYVSPHIEEILGFKQREWLNDPVRWYKQIHPDDKTRWSIEAAEMFISGKALRSVYRVLARDGHTVWFHCEAKMVRNDDGRPWFIHGVGFDITELKQAEAALQKANDQLELRVEERTAQLAETNEILRNEISERKRFEETLRQSEERYRELYENAYDLIYTHDLLGNITSINKAVTETTGYSFDAARQLKIDDLILPTDLATVYQALLPLIADGAPATYEMKIITNNGREIPVEASSRLVKVAERPVGIQTIARNITERKQAEELMKIAHEAALESARVKSQFLANMSHEIRTPLNGVMGMIDLLLNTELTGQQPKFVKTMRNCSQMLLTIINEILDLSKLEAGKMSIETIELDLPELLDEIVSIFSEQAAAKKLMLTAHLSKDLPVKLLGDPMRLRQILMNLLSNAIKFTEKGGIVIDISLAEQSSDSLVVRFEVSDSGIGVSSAERARLFNPFAQADQTITRKYGGTGLGLAICKQLTGLMGGEIDVETNPQGGSTFWFTTRLHRRTVEVTTRDQTVLDDQRDSKRLGNLESGARILLVEDNEVNQAVAQAMLERLNCQVDVAGGGQQALHKVTQNHYDLIFMDFQMPVMDGYETTIAIRAREEHQQSHIPIIALTAGTTEGDRMRCFAAGMDDYITKPMVLKDLYAVLLRWTDKSEVQIGSPRLSTATINTNQQTATCQPTESVANSAKLLDESIDPIIFSGLQSLQLERGVDLETKIFQPFFDGFAEYLQSLKEAVARGDYQEVKNIAHSLKGSSSSLAAQRLSAFFKELELTATTTSMVEIVKLLSQIEREFEHYHDAVLAALNNNLT